MQLFAALFLLLFLSPAVADDLIEKAQEAVRGHLRDPASAQFEQLRIRIGADNYGKERRTLCGFVNAKNATGGYVGRTRFFYFIEQDDINAVGNHDIFAGFINPFLGGDSYRHYCE